MEEGSSKALKYVPKNYVPVPFALNAVRQNRDAIGHVPEKFPMTFQAAEEGLGLTPEEEAQVSKLVRLMQNSDDQAITEMRALHESGDPRATKLRLEALARYEILGANSRPEGLSPTPKN